MAQHVPRHPAHCHAPPRALLKWIGVAATGTLLLGTAPMAGQLAPEASAAAPVSPSGTAVPVVTVGIDTEGTAPAFEEGSA